MIAANEIPNWANPNFGSTAADNVMETVFQSIRWSGVNVQVNLANLVPGSRYKLQLLFAEGGNSRRTFDVLVQGARIVNEFIPSDAQNREPATSAGSAIAHEFTATSNMLNIVMDGSDVAIVPGLDRNPILSGVTLEELAAPALVALPQNLPIHDSSYNAASNPHTINAPTAKPGFILNIELSTSSPFVFTPRLFSIVLMTHIPTRQRINTKPILSRKGMV